MTNTRKLLKCTVIIGVMVFAAMMLYTSPVFASADRWGKTSHIGKYYFKYNYSDEHVYISKKKSTGFRKTPVETPRFVSNGRQIVYSEFDGMDNCLWSYDISEKKFKLLKELPGEGIWSIREAKGKYIWMNVFYGVNYNDEVVLYKLDIKTKKLSRYKNAGLLTRLYGKYYYCNFGQSKEYEYRGRTGTGTYPAAKGCICTITKKGTIRKIRKLGYVCEAETHYFNKFNNWGKIKTLYFTRNKSHDLYRVRYNGKKLKKVKSFKGYVTEIGKKSCLAVSSKGEIKYKY